MKVELNLTIKRKWLDKIASGEKLEEYRDCEHRQVQRAFLECSNSRWYFEREPVAIFRNGYTMQSRAVAVRIVGYDIRGRESVKHPEWGEPRGRRLHLVVKLGSIVTKGTYAEVKAKLKEMGDKR